MGMYSNPPEAHKALAREKAIAATSGWGNEWPPQDDRNAVWAAVHDRSGGICELCNRRACTLVHHIDPSGERLEGAHDLLGVCGSCHARLHGLGIEPLSASLGICVTDEEKAMVIGAAEADGLSRSQWMRKVLLAELRKRGCDIGHRKISLPGS